MFKLVCSLCSYRSFFKLKCFLAHLRIRHASDPDFRVICGIAGCKREYNKYASFSKHIYRSHTDFFTENESFHTPHVHDNSVDDDSVERQPANNKSVDVFNMRQQLISDIGVLMLKYSVKLREKFHIPASTHSDIMEDCSSLISSILTAQNQLINIHLKQKGYDAMQDNNLQRILDPQMYKKILKDCSSSYKLKRRCVSELGMVEPKEYIVGNYKGYHVPITDILKLLIQKEDITGYFVNNFISDKNHLTNYTCGEAFNSLPSCPTDGNLIRLHLYNDEFDVVNPIAAKRGKHKINATYFSIGNLPTKYRSKLKHIYLVNIIKHKAVQSEGYLQVFSLVVNELNKLWSDGLTVTLSDGNVIKFYVILCTIAGDNLSSNALAGFRQVFNSGRVCRVCMVHYSQLSEKMCERDVVLRTYNLHKYHIQAVEENPSNIAIYGVCGPSLFSSLPYFNIINSFPPDIMHDCLEGVIPFLITTILKRLVVCKGITIVQLNLNITSFPYKGSDRTNKPEPVKLNCDIIGSASQKMCFFRLLPFFVSLEKCPSVKKLYNAAYTVIMYTFSRCVSMQDLDYFSQKIEKLRRIISLNFTEIRITPKFHYLIHYPTMMARYGPLRELWCMRFEAKHQYFKAVASSLGNFINIASTLATRHQMLQCYEFSSNVALDSEIILSNVGKLLKRNSFCIDIQQCLCTSALEVWAVNDATISSCTYSVETAIVIDFTCDEDPVFLYIKYLLLPYDGHLDIIGKLLVPVEFSSKYYAYRVTDNGWGHIHAGEEKDSVQLLPYEMPSGMFISMPYYIPSWSTNY